MIVTWFVSDIKVEISLDNNEHYQMFTILKKIKSDKQFNVIEDAISWKESRFSFIFSSFDEFKDFFEKLMSI